MMSANYQSQPAHSPPGPEENGNLRTLQVYLLGSIEFETFFAFQRRLHYEITGDRGRAVLILCEHPPIITVGRQGSRGDILLEADELRRRRWAVRWVHRGGGCVLHLPGQLAVYLMLSLDRLRCGVSEYMQRLGTSIGDVLADFSIRGPIRATGDGVWVGERTLATLGVSVRDWVTGFGAYVNLNPPLDAYRSVRAPADVSTALTSLQRERRGPVRPSLVRNRLIEHIQQRFGFDQVTLFSDHSALHGLTQRCSDPRVMEDA